MRLSNRIGIFVFITMTLTLLLLTTLMHLKYHTTHSELVNTRYAILLNDMKWSIERGVSLGVDLSQFKNIQQIIDTGVKQDPTIKDIVVFDFKKSKPEIIFSSLKTKTISLAKISDKISESIYSTKKEYWAFDATDNKSYVGVGFKDALGIITGGIYICYSTELINKNSKKEIESLYVSFLYSIVLIALLSYIISHRTTRSLDLSLLAINTSLINVIADTESAQDVDQLNIPDSEIKQSYIQTISAYQQMKKSLDHIKSLLDGIKWT